MRTVYTIYSVLLYASAYYDRICWLDEQVFVTAHLIHSDDDNDRINLYQDCRIAKILAPP